MSDYVYEESRAMRVSELRALIADLPGEDYIFVDGYEGGFDMPRLEKAKLAAIEPWVKPFSHGGPWREPWPEDENPDNVEVWVLARES